MKITLFTRNQNRHNYFINLLSLHCDELFVVQECGTIFPGSVPGLYPKSEIMENYFHNVNQAQKKLFCNSYINKFNKKIRTFPILFGDLNKCSLELLKEFLSSDLYIVFGGSYIKGELVDFLVLNKAINIHMGVSPYYRGTDCNFWALNDNNPHLVGSTIHLLSKGLDSGPILFHAMSKIKSNPFEYTMSTVKSAFHSIADRIDNKTIFNINPLVQDKTQEIRYSKNEHFTDEVITKFLNKKIDLFSKNFDSSLLKDAYYFAN